MSTAVDFIFRSHRAPEDFLQSYWRRNQQTSLPLKDGRCATLQSVQECLLPALHDVGRLRLPPGSFLYTNGERRVYSTLRPVMHASPPQRLHADPWLYGPVHWVVLPRSHFPLALSTSADVGRFVPMLPPRITSEQFERGSRMGNFSFSARSALLFALWGFHMNKEMGVRLRSENDEIFLIGVKLEADRVWSSLQTSQTHFWNRNYLDFFLHFTHWNFTPAEASTSEIFTLGFTASEAAHFIFSELPHRQVQGASAGTCTWYFSLT